MALGSVISKGVLIKGVGSLTLLSGASVGGYYIYGSVVNGSTKPEAKNLTVIDNFSPKFLGCFNETFFPGASFTKDKIRKAEIKDADLFSPETKPTTPELKTEGCTTIRYHGDSKKWAFESETVIKDGKSGISVWLELNSLETNNQRYQIYFLEKASDGDNWIVKFGFVSHEFKNLTSISSPDDSIKLSYSSSTLPNKWNSNVSGDLKYSGIWEKDEKLTSILPNGVFESFKKGFTEKYVYKSDGLFESEKPQDRKSKLTEWVDKFKNEKGKWTKSN